MDITLRDFSTLAPGESVSDCVVDFCGRLLRHQHEGKASDGPRVLILSTELGTILRLWGEKGEPGSDPPDIVKAWTYGQQLWEDEGPRLLIVPTCYNMHFYALVALLDRAAPRVFVLESIGGLYAVPPPETYQLINLLQWQKAQAGLEFVGIAPTVLKVPRQERGSNNCGLYCLRFMEEIVEEPEYFEVGALLDNLDDWFSRRTVENKREEIAGNLKYLSTVQRGPGGVMEGEPEVILPEFSAMPTLAEKVK